MDFPTQLNPSLCMFRNFPESGVRAYFLLTKELAVCGLTRSVSEPPGLLMVSTIGFNFLHS